MDGPSPGSTETSELPQFITARLVRPIQTFARMEASSGIAMVAAAVLAVIWANSMWSDQYFELWHRELVLELSWITVEESLVHAVNDGLMTVFFFAVGLEIKREIVQGELASPKKAALPAAAALGGMVVPAGIYLALNAGTDADSGWGIPMATDIAFAIGVLSLLGRRVPFGVKVFLLALAIVDDLGAIMVIAIFYTDSISIEALIWAGGILALIIAMGRVGIRNISVYWAIGLIFWLAVFKSGIHATLAGVVLAALTPATAGQSASNFMSGARRLIDDFETAHQRGDHEAANLYTARMEHLSRDTESPLDRLEHSLLPWVSFVIVPLFALSNAGLEMDGDFLADAAKSNISWGIALGLLFGKVIGITVFTLVVLRLGLGTLPQGMNYGHLVGVGLLGGVGFTVALFITDLAFTEQLFKDEAKAGVFAASILASVAGLLFLHLFSDDAPEEPGSAGGDNVQVGSG